MGSSRHIAKRIALLLLLTCIYFVCARLGLLLGLIDVDGNLGRG